MKKLIIPIIAGAIVFAGCSTNPPETTSPSETPSESLSVVSEPEDLPIQEVTEAVSEETKEEVNTEESYVAVQDGRETITNGADETINGKVDDIISISKEKDYAYEAGNIKVVNGDCVIIEGKDSIKAVKEGSALIECDLMDNETGTMTHTTFAIVIK